MTWLRKGWMEVDFNRGNWGSIGEVSVQQWTSYGGYDKVDDSETVHYPLDKVTSLG